MIITKRLRFFVLAIQLAIFAAPAFAGDILFIDLNSAAPEIDAVSEFIAQEQSSGREQGTQLVIVPSLRRVSLANRRRISEIFKTLIDPSSRYYSDHVCSTPNSVIAEEKCNEQLKLANQGRAEVYEIITGRKQPRAFEVGQMNANEVLGDLRSALSGPYQFSRVIISGHHDPGNYNFSNTPDVDRKLYGIFFNDLTTKLAGEFLNGSRSTQSVRSLILLGCWTARPENFSQAWSHVLPQAAFRFGFVEAAPHNYNPVNIAILKSVLRVEAEMGEARTNAELKAGFNKINRGDRDIAVLVYDKYVSKAGIRILLPE